MASMLRNSGLRGPSGSSAGQNMTGGNIIPRGYKQGQLAQFTPEQQQLFQHLFSNVGPDSYLSRLSSGDEAAFQQAEAPAYRHFGEALGQLGSRFSQLAPGSMSAQRSSGFKQAGGQLASDFAQDLASKRMGLQRQALIDLMGLSESLLSQRPYEQFLIKKQPKQSWWQKLLGSTLPIGGAALGGAFGGPAGAALGGQLGGSFASGLFD